MTSKNGGQHRDRFAGLGWETAEVQGGADIEIIELLDADPSVFGASTVSASSRAPRPARPRPTWMMPLAVAVVAIVAAVAVLVAWKPWVNDVQIRLAFPATAPVEPTLTEQLVFDDPPARLSSASLGEGPDVPVDFEDSGGYLFAAPDASLRLGQGTSGRWAVFFATSAEFVGELERQESAVEITVQGAPGQLTAAVGDQLARVAFGPLDGRMYTVVTSDMSQADTIDFAEVVTISDRAPAVKDISAIEGLQPLCNMNDFSAANSLVFMAAYTDYTQAQIVGARYGGEANRFTVTSQWAAESGLTCLRFYVGGEVDALVHGQPALTLEVDASESLLAFGVELGSIVAWIEGGRLVMVTGQLPIDELLALAESVRPATEAEWAEVSELAE